MTRIALAEMVQELRSELETALESAEGQEIRFDLGEVTLEVHVEVTKEASGKAGVKFWVFTGAEATGGVAKSQGHKVVLKLQPRTKAGERLTLGQS